jgi:hypothetical protein
MAGVATNLWYVPFLGSRASAQCWVLCVAPHFDLNMVTHCISRFPIVRLTSHLTEKGNGLGGGSWCQQPQSQPSALQARAVGPVRAGLFARDFLGHPPPPPLLALSEGGCCSANCGCGGCGCCGGGGGGVAWGWWRWWWGWAGAGGQ